jgi:hypothetical protein
MRALQRGGVMKKCKNCQHLLKHHRRDRDSTYIYACTVKGASRWGCGCLHGEAGHTDAFLFAMAQVDALRKAVREQFGECNNRGEVLEEFLRQVRQMS